MTAVAASPLALSVVSDLFTCLFGPETLVRAATATPNWTRPHVIAEYADDAGVSRGWIVCDLEFAAAGGAALSMIPPRVATDAVKAGDIPPNILENLREVLNVCVNLFQSFGFAHVVLGQVQAGRSPAGRVELPAGRSWSAWKVEIPKYPAGCLYVAGGLE